MLDQFHICPWRAMGGSTIASKRPGNMPCVARVSVEHGYTRGLSTFPESPACPAVTSAGDVHRFRDPPGLRCVGRGEDRDVEVRAVGEPVGQSGSESSGQRG